MCRVGRVSCVGCPPSVRGEGVLSPGLLILSPLEGVNFSGRRQFQRASLCSWTGGEACSAILTGASWRRPCLGSPMASHRRAWMASGDGGPSSGGRGHRRLSFWTRGEDVQGSQREEALAPRAQSLPPSPARRRSPYSHRCGRSRGPPRTSSAPPCTPAPPSLAAAPPGTRWHAGAGAGR